jgi:predicted nucleic acid-binding protein
MDVFDADVIIYAAVLGHPLGRRVLGLFHQAGRKLAGAGSVLLLPEVLSTPLRDGRTGEVRILAGLLARIDLRPVDRATADVATALAIKYGLRAPDAIHLGTAVALGADRFITSNQRDFPLAISEVRVVYPTDLPDRSPTEA